MARSLRSGSSYTGWSSSSYGRAGRWNNSNRNKRTAERRETRSKKKRFAESNSSSESSVEASESNTSNARITRTSTIRCTNYGRRREDIYPNHFFCSPCRNWEISIDTGTVGKQKRDSVRNRCCAGHTDPYFPTTLKPDVIPYKRPIVNCTGSDDSTFSESIESDSDDPPIAPDSVPETLTNLPIDVEVDNALNLEKHSLQQQITQLKLKINAQEHTIHRLKKKLQSAVHSRDPRMQTHAVYGPARSGDAHFCINFSRIDRAHTGYSSICRQRTPCKPLPRLPA